MSLARGVAGLPPNGTRRLFGASYAREIIAKTEYFVLE